MLLRLNRSSPTTDWALKEKSFWHDLRTFGEKHRDLRDAAFKSFSDLGGYPLAHKRSDSTWEEISSQLVETVVKRAIQHDLRIGERGRRRDEALLEEVFRLACRYVGQSPGQALYLNHGDSRGLRSFIEKSVYNAPFGVLVTQTDEVASDDPRIVTLPLSTLLMMR